MIFHSYGRLSERVHFKVYLWLVKKIWNPRCGTIGKLHWGLWQPTWRYGIAKKMVKLGEVLPSGNHHPVIKHGNGKCTIWIGDFPIETSIYNGFPRGYICRNWSSKLWVRRLNSGPRRMVVIRINFARLDTLQRRPLRTHTHIYIYIYTHTHTHTQIYIYIYIYVLQTWNEM